MRSLRLHLALLPLLLMSLALAQTPATSGGAVTEFEVNGLKVILKQRPGTQTLAAGLFVRGGSANITAANAGIENLLLNVSIDGSAHFPRALLRAELARMGGTINYGTNYDYSALSLACTRENFDRMWEIFTDVALHPALLPQDVETERQRLVSGRSGTDTAEEVIQEEEAKVIYAGHPYANDPRGTVDSLKKLTVADLKLYHRQIMQTSHLLLVVVGDLDVFTLKSRVTAAFSAVPRGDYRASLAPPLKFTPAPRLVARGIASTYVEGSYAGPAFSSSDFAALELAVSFLRDAAFNELRIRHGLSYSPTAELRAQSASVGSIYYPTTDVNQATDLFLKQISRLKKDPVSADDLLGTVSQYVTTYYMDNQTSAAQAGMLAQYELIGGGWRNAETMLTRLRAVTPADVQRVAKQYMRNLQFTVVGDDKSVDKKLMVTEP
jgi:zinc protease